MADDNKDVASFIAHYGKKGMKWGVTNEDASNASTPTAIVEKKAASTRVSKSSFEKVTSSKKPNTSSAAELNRNKQKFKDKLEDPNAQVDASRFTPQQKATAKKIAIGVGVVGGLAALGYMANKSGALDSTKSALTRPKILALPYVERPGKSISNRDFRDNIKVSERASWSKGQYVTEASYARPGFTLPAGHTFDRISTNPNSTSFNPGTYAVHNKKDYDRYVAGFRAETATVPFYKVQFNTKTPMHVPDLNTTLGTLQEVMTKSSGKKATPESALSAYYQLSGGKWSDPTSQKLFSALEKKGYGALVDEMDADVIGDSPLVVFGRSQLTEKKTTPITDTMIESSRNSLVELANRKT